MTLSMPSWAGAAISSFSSFNGVEDICDDFLVAAAAAICFQDALHAGLQDFLR
jgi:hypothetical protein